MVRGLVRLCAAIGVLGLLGGFAGALHPAGDSLAIFRLFIAAAVLVLGAGLLVLRDRAWGLYFAGLAVVAGLAPASQLMPADAAPIPGDYALYQRNLLFLARDTEAIVAEVATLQPDFVTLQEVSSANILGVFDRLPAEYDRALCPFARVGAVAVAARHRIVAGSVLCIERLGMIAAQVATPDGPVWLVSIHLHWPWPYGQADQVAQILPLLSRMQGGPVLIGGDFNMVRWSHVLADVERASGARLVRQGLPTYRLSAAGPVSLGLEIDHILLPQGAGAEVRRLDFLGSDHRGLIARFGF